MARNYYEILGVEKSSNDDEIKKAYRKLAHKHHPDKQGGDTEKFKEINEAYQVLSDKTKRQQYDQFGQTFNGGQGGFGGGGQGGFGGFDFGGFSSQGFDFNGGGFEDIFSDIFGGGGNRSQGGNSKKAGRDIQIDAEISFEEMVTGAKREVELFRKVVCDSCAGSGGQPGSKKETCSVCKGNGQIKKTMQSFFGSFAQVVVCANCDGAGYLYTEKCKKCHGDGAVKENQKILIEIPKGISNGQTISMQGKGEAGERGGRSGDLYINIHVKPHKDFERKGNDIHSKEKISFSQAVLGDKIEVKTIEGNLSMKIPAGTQSGDVFRIKNKGVPVLQRNGQGDQLIKIIVDIPKSPNREQRKIIEDLAKTGL
jgi:molecular chaperone DnaJ